VQRATKPVIPPSRRAPRPTLVVSTALLCLLVQALGYAHLLLVRHATCLEHAEIVHSPSPEAGAGARAATAGPRPLHRRVEGTAPEDQGHGDEHCLALASRRREGATLVPTQLAGPALSAAGPSVAPPTTPSSFHPVPLLHLAPKSSPPV
jgi:hypothetical protein